MVTKIEVAKAIVNQLAQIGQVGQSRLYLMGPLPSRTPAFAETYGSYAEYLASSRPRASLLRLLWEIITDETLEDA